jgi:hypothetical protein
MKVLIELNRNNIVQRIENNTENEQYRKLKAEVGDKLDEQLIALLLMNPHRFQVIRSEVTR